MSHGVEPQVFLIGENQVNNEGLQSYLSHIGADNWETDALSDVEEIIEVQARSCYKSFGTELNQNITRVRESNKDYIQNIIKVRHGSVIEHGFISFQFCDITRVCTHELVRHRAGTATSQESLRFVRADDLGYFLPSCFNNIGLEDEFKEHFELCEQQYNKLLSWAGFYESGNNIEFTEMWKYEINKQGLDLFNQLSFEKKKEYTSAARRVLPIGMSTNMGWSANIRALRTILEQRTNPSSEEEIRILFSKVAEVVFPKYPWLFSDYTVEMVNDIPWYKTENSKV